MIIYIEVLVIFILILIFVSWKLWSIISIKKLAKKYKPENDKSRKGGIENEGRVTTTEAELNDKTENIGRFDKFEGRKLLQTANINSSGENSNISRKNSNLFDGFLKRRK